MVLFLSLPLIVGCQEQSKPQRHITQDDLIEANRNLVAQDANRIKEWVDEKQAAFQRVEYRVVVHDSGFWKR